MYYELYNYSYHIMVIYKVYRTFSIDTIYLLYMTYAFETKTVALNS